MRCCLRGTDPHGGEGEPVFNEWLTLSSSKERAEGAAVVRQPTPNAIWHFDFVHVLYTRSGIVPFLTFLAPNKTSNLRVFNGLYYFNSRRLHNFIGNQLTIRRFGFEGIAGVSHPHSASLAHDRTRLALL